MGRPLSSVRQLCAAAVLFLPVSLGAPLPAMAGASTAYSSVDVAEGNQLAHTLCINCHVVDTSSPVIRTDRVPSFSWIANQDGITPERLGGWMSISHERMPDLTLTRDEIRKLSAYILSLRR